MTLTAAPEAAAIQACGTAGKHIGRLTAYAGLLLPSYGDYTNEHFAHDLIGLDLATASTWTTLGALDTEQIIAMENEGDLIVPFIDPLGSVANPESGQVARLTSSHDLTILTNVTPVPIHVFDSVITADGWFLFGASDIDGSAGSATIWRSTDDGATWTVELHVPSGTGWNEAVDAGARFYGVQHYSDGTLIANMLGAPEARLYRRNPGGRSPWVDVSGDDPATAAFGNATPVGFAHDGVEFYVNPDNGTITLRAEDAAARSTLQALIPGIIQSASVGDDGALWMLTFDGEVYRLGPTGATEHRATLADNAARSLTVAAGRLWVGTTDGRVGYATTPGGTP